MKGALLPNCKIAYLPLLNAASPPAINQGGALIGCGGTASTEWRAMRRPQPYEVIQADVNDDYAYYEALHVN